MNVVPTIHTKRMAHRLIRATPELGAEAALSALAHVPAEQVPALVALLARHAAGAICIPAATLPAEVVDINRRVRPGTPPVFSEAQRREAHRRYRTGERTPPVVAGEREYQRMRQRVKRVSA